jgi:hypothetical protein
LSGWGTSVTHTSRIFPETVATPIKERPVNSLSM